MSPSKGSSARLPRRQAVTAFAIAFPLVSSPSALAPLCTDAAAIVASTPDGSAIGAPVADELEAQVAAYAEVGVYGDTGAPSTDGRFDTDLVAGLYDDAGTIIWPG